MWELPRYHAQAYAAPNGEAMKQNRLLASFCLEKAA
jgi:hypothetical protein